MDYGGRFIDAALQLQKGVALEYGSGKVAKVPEEEGVEASKVVFKQVRKAVYINSSVLCCRDIMFSL